MPSRVWWVVNGLLVIAMVAICVVWQSEKRAQEQLSAQLQSTQGRLDALTAAQSARDAVLKTQLGQLSVQKTDVKTPQQILQALPDVLPLPGPIAADLTTNKAAAGDLRLPAASLRPLYDYALDCQACQAKLANATADLHDEQQKSAAWKQERDAALRVAKSGSVLQRVVRAAKWFAIGAAAGGVAVKVAHR